MSICGAVSCVSSSNKRSRIVYMSPNHCPLVAVNTYFMQFKKADEGGIREFGVLHQAPKKVCI